MNEMLALFWPWLIGGLLGVVFYGGLWWTVKQCVSSPRAGLWFSGSLLLRMGIALAGFYWVGGGQWQRLLPCLLGFIMARLLVAFLLRPGQAWLAKPSEKKPGKPTQESRHAP